MKPSHKNEGRAHTGMQRRNIGLAIAAMACTAASVQAQTAPASTVTIYGLLDISVARATAAGGHMTKVDSGHANGSRLGFRGSEDLGGGLRANFLLESGINADTGANGQNQGAGAKFFGRGAYVGLAGGFGEVRIGRTLVTISSEAQAVGDAFGLGGSGNVQGIQPATGRSNNTVWYQSPTFGGATAKLSYSAGERTNKAGNHVAAGLFYAQGLFSAAAATTVLRHPTDLSLVRWVNTGASYNFGSFKLFGTLASFKNPGAAITPAVHAGLDNVVQLAAVPTVVGYYAGQDDRSASIGASIPLGAGTLLTQLVKVDDRGPLDRDAKQFGLQYMYPLSKRTTLYAGWGKVKNRNGASYALTGATTQAGLDASGNSSAYHMGVRHAF